MSRTRKNPPKRVSLVERDSDVRSFYVFRVNTKTLKIILLDQVSKSAKLMTDESFAYVKIGKEFASHESVWHGRNEYARGNAHTNTVEGYFSLLKHGLAGTYHHIGSQHLQRYVTEFDFKYNGRKLTDMERTETAVRGISGKRLTYRPNHFSE